MIKHILTIIKNEYKSNLTLWLELAVVALFLWYIVDNIYIVLNNYFKPLGFDTEQTYIMNLGYLEPESPYYHEYESSEDAAKDIEQIIDRLRAIDQIEAVSVSNMSSPHIGNNRSTKLFNDTIGTKDHGLIRMMSPEFFKVFRYKSVNGSTEELVKAFEENKFVISETMCNDLFDSPEEAIGKVVSIERGKANEGSSGIVGAVSTDIRYDNFWSFDSYFGIPMHSGYLPSYANKNITYLEFCLRVKPEADRDFLEYFWENISEHLQIGNFYASQIASIPERKVNFQMNQTNALRTKGLLISFLLVNIFLGVMGVFWFKTQARKQEIGIRIALGDTSRGVLRKFYSEGLLILMTAMIPAMITMLVLKYADELNTYLMDFTFSRYLIGFVTTFLLLAIMIMIGIWLPARKAVAVPPAIALADE